MNLAIGIALEGGLVKQGIDLGCRLAWLWDQHQTIDQILHDNDLPPVLRDASVLDMSVGRCAILTCGNEILVVARRQRQIWSVIFGTNSEREVTALELHERFLAQPNVQVHVMPLVRGWEPSFHLYGRIEDALCDRAPDQHVFAIDWSNKMGKDGNTKRFILCSEQRIDVLAEFLCQRPLCDRNLYSVNMAGLVMRLIQLDVEAMLDLNPRLKTEEAQKAYADELLNQLRRFLNAELPEVLTTFASDADRFSSHIYALYELPDQEAHDNLVIHFWEWLWKQPNHERLLIYHQFPPKKTLGQGFAIDVLAGGRNREMRGPMQGKLAKRSFRCPPGWTMAAALRFTLPNRLSPSPPPPQGEGEIHTACYRRNDNNSMVELCNTSGRPPPEDTFLYKFPQMYRFLSPYRIQHKKEANVMWLQGKRAKHKQREEQHVETFFAVPWNKYNELLRLQVTSPVPTMLHEVANGNQRPFCDVDGTRLEPTLVAREYAHFSKSRVAIKLSPPNPKDAPGLFRFHLIAYEAVLSGAFAQDAHRWHFEQWMRARYTEADWPNGCSDREPTCLRKLGSDKPLDHIGSFSNRALQFGGVYDPHSDTLMKEHPNPHQICSIHTMQPPDLEAERMHLLTPDYYAQNKPKIIGDAYDSTNEQHRAIAHEISLVLAHYPDYKGKVVIESVAKEEDGSWSVRVGHFCIQLNQQFVYGTKQAMPGRQSLFEHVFNRGGFRFYPTHISLFCSDKDCKQNRQLPYSNDGNTREILFCSPPPAAAEEEDNGAETVALNYIRHQEGANTRWKHYPRLHAYKRGERFFKVPHACYTDPDEPDALLFHEFAPANVVSFARNMFTLSDGKQVSLNDIAPESHPVRHRVHHIRRMRSIFHSVERENILFDQVPRLWDYELAPLTRRETWYTFSGKGTGKTHQNIRIIGNEQVPKPRISRNGNVVWNQQGGCEARVLILSPLIAVAAFYARSDKYDAANYDDEYFRTHPHELAYQTRLVCSLESLHKLPPDYMPDIVLMDESEWLLQIFSGSTMSDCRQQSWARFRSIMRNAKLVVASDSRLAKKTYECLHELRKDGVEKLFYNFQAENGNAYTHYKSEAAWFDQLEAAIKRRDGPIFLPTTSREQAIQLDAFIRQHDPDANILLITGETYHDQPHVAHAVTHCDEEWIKYQYIIMTPVVGPAVDFNKVHFRYCFAWATPLSGTPAQFFQMMGRVRHLISLHVHYFVNRSRTKGLPFHIAEESIRTGILQSARDTARLGIQLTEDVTWNVIEQAFENGVYDKLFFNIHVANLFEEQLGKKHFAREFALLIKEQQGVAPIECEAPGSLEQMLRLEEQRKARKEEKADADWNAFDSAPDISEQEVAAIDKDIKRGIHVEPERMQSLKKRKFRMVYALDDDHEITREQFEEDNPKRRLALRNHEETLLRPHVKQLLIRHDLGRLVGVAKRLRTMADLHLKALPRQQQECVLRIFGFPRDACVAQVLHDLSPHLHSVTLDYCKQLMVLDQLKLQRFPVPKKATGITWLRTFLSELWDVSLIAHKRLLKRCRDAYRIDGIKSLAIVQGHFPNYNYTPPPSQRVVENFPVEAEESVWRAFVLAFSPRHLAAFPPVRCTVDNAGFVPTRLEGNFTVLDFPKLCKKHCPNGLLLSFAQGHLYYQYEQFWTLINGVCTQYDTVQAAASVFPPTTVGALFLAPENRPRLLLREAPAWNIVGNWPARFLERVAL